MDPDSWGQIIILFFLLVLSTFFSASETALTTLSKIRLRNMVDEGVKGAKEIEGLMKNPKRLLNSILIGNNIVNIGSSAMAASIAIKISGNNSMAISMATGIITVLILVFCEITPKTLANQNSEKYALFLAKPVSFFVFVLTPVVMLLDLVTGFIITRLGGDANKHAPLFTEAELKTIVKVSHEEGVLEVDERRMINNVFDFGDFHAKDVMIPRTDMVAVSYDSTVAEIIAVFKEEGFSRMPVYKDSTDDIIGILHLKDFIFKDFTENEDIEKYMREPYFTYESKPTSELFTIMRTKRIPMAIILDEHGGTLGLVTLEDLIEEIVGDISDEYDDIEEEITVIKEDEYIVDGATKISDVNEMIGTRLESEDYDSIGGYVIGVIGRIPDEGEVVESDGIRFIIEELDKNRIEKLRIHT